METKDEYPRYVPVASLKKADSQPVKIDCVALKASWVKKTLRERCSQWAQYAYFLRFTLLSWLLLPLLCLLDGCSGVSSITRGIMTLSRGWQAFYAMFFVTALMVTVLICVRNAVRNGQARFLSEPPVPLSCFLDSDTPLAILTALAVAQVPAIITLTYVAAITVSEQGTVGFGRHDWGLWAGYGGGLLFAFCFWYIVSVIYLWVYPNQDGRNPAPLIFPVMAGFATARDQNRPRLAMWLESVAKVALKVTHEGYSEEPGQPLWELHTFSAVALAAFLVLYLLLYPLLAPVNIGGGALDVVVACGLVLLFFFGSSNAPPERTPVEHAPVKTRREKAVEYCSSFFDIGLMGKLFLTLNALLLAGFLTLITVDGRHDSVLLGSAFPTLASLLVIVIFGVWLLAGASFLLDRYRMPVMTLVLFLIVAAKYLPFDQEHYFEVKPATKLEETDLPSPSSVVDSKATETGEPYIIVTASGGGIQAAEWTAQVMALLETRFRDDPALSQAHYNFHDHVLLLSGVSGGSVGLMPFLLEYTAAPGKGFPKLEVPASALPDDEGETGTVDLLSERLTRAPACSSLEAVAWGLEYYDLQRLILTFRIPWLQVASDGNAPDRTWALGQALSRNMDDPDCGTPGFLSPSQPPGQLASGMTISGLPSIASAQALTLKQSAILLKNHTMPAFTFNTTVAETGGRFLLSNYGVPFEPPIHTDYPVQPGDDFLPAENFLHAYTESSHCEQGVLKQDCYADLPLATAARLSATFPVVSSGTRLPKRFAGRASHFLDGGYFDNDGTASAIEFLTSALKIAAHPAAPFAAPSAANDPGATPAPTLPPKVKLPLRILLIEIRDGDDLNPAENQDDWNHQTGLVREAGTSGPTPWTDNTQVLAPLLGMWNAGHVSVTRRNRRELCLMEGAAKGKLDVHHVVLGIPAQPVANRADEFKVAPLSWKLTADQKHYIERWATQGIPTQRSLVNAIDWVKDQLAHTTAPAPDQASGQTADADNCQVVDQSYMRR